MVRSLQHKAISLLAIALIVFSLPKPLRAEFKLMDAIEEFGEKRFAKPIPARIHMGPVKIHPTIRTKVSYDNNILLEDTDGREDVIFNVQPGVIISIPYQRHEITVGYEAEFENFVKKRHHLQNDQNQNAFALLDLKFPDWYINILDQLTETSGRSGTTFTGRIPRIDHAIYPKIGYRWNRFTIEEGFRHYTRDFRRQVDDSLDFQLVEWTTILFYDLFARLKLLIEGKWSQIDYDDNFTRDGSFTQTRIGFEGEVMPNLMVKMRTGMEFRNYKVSSEPDFYSWVGSLSADYKFRDNLSFKASFERVPIEATFNTVNFFKRHIARFGFEYELGSQWVHFQNMKMYRDDYGERATVGTRSGYRRDYHLAYETGLRYIPREWLEFELAYEYLRRSSNFSTFDYTDHRLSFTSVLSY